MKYCSDSKFPSKYKKLFTFLKLIGLKKVDLSLFLNSNKYVLFLFNLSNLILIFLMKFLYSLAKIHSEGATLADMLKLEQLKLLNKYIFLLI